MNKTPATGITAIDPTIRLQLLQLYINYRVDSYGKKVKTFEQFIHDKYGYLIPGTLAHACVTATHCYYCNRKFTVDKNFKPTIDHWVPRSKGLTERYVICCRDCNNRKSDFTPDELISKFMYFYYRGQNFWGYSGKKLKFIGMQLHNIRHEILHNTGPRIYYFKR